MLQAFLVLTPKPGKMAALIEEYKRAAIVEAGVPYGLQRGEAVVVPALAQDAEHLLITSIWQDQKAYDGWLSAPERVSVTTGVWPLLMTEQADAVRTVTRDSVDAGRPLPLEPVFPEAEGRTDPVITVVA